MPPEQRKRIASAGADALHASGKAKYFTSKSASAAGRKSQRTGKAHRFDSSEASQAGKKSAARRKEQKDTAPPE